MTYKQPVRVLVGLLILSLVGCVEKPSGSDTNNDTTPIDMAADMTAPEDMDEDKPEDMAADMLVEDMPGDMPVVDMPVDMPVDMGPCGGACGDDTPVCDEANNTCVGCLDVSDCDGDTPACDTTTNTCVACTDETFCDGDTPVCDTANTTCVGCLGDENCSGDTPVCDTSSTTCVACLDNTSCESPDASLCGSDQTCGACMADADCSHLGLNRCVQGVCTECTVATEQDDCGNNACLPDGTCGNTPLESLTACQPCQADNECFADHRCVPMNFGDPAMPHGNYCLKVASTGCARPFLVSITNESVSGAASAEYCGINQLNTTCEAILDLLEGDKACVEDSDCGAQGLDDAVCGTTLAGDVCTITCELNSQCSSVQTCDMAENYCK